MRASALVFPLLGTDVTVTVDAATESSAQRAVDKVVAELRRWQRLFSVFEPESDLRRWREGRLKHPGTELVAVLGLAADWYRRSGGTFHPAAAGLRDAWLAAEVAGVPPDTERLRDLAAAPLPFEVREGRLTRTGDCSGVDLNAIAKGAAVDAAVIAAVGLADVTAVLVNAGGDLRRHGPGSVVVDVADPGDPHDDAPALATWELSQGAVATSSGVRRGFRVGERWYGHVLDPRTGLPIAGTLQATVVAPDAATADAAATAALVLPPDDARDLLLREGLSGFLVTADHSTLRVGWPPLPHATGASTTAG